MTNENEPDSTTKTDGDVVTTPSPADADDEPEEVWDILRVIDPTTTTATTCRMDECTAHAIVVWKSSLDAEDDVWPMCEKCQETEFGGWPEGVERTTTTTDEDEESNKDAMNKGETPVATTNDRNSECPPGETKDGENNEDDDEAEESWDIKKVMTVEELNGCTVKCATETCRLAAAVLYLSSGGERWYSCLDCQESDFDGWPEVSDLPISFMTDEHKALMISKCSKYKKTAMPVFATPSPQNKGDGTTQSLTPRAGGTGASSAAVVTPAEGPPPKKIPKPSKEHLEMHRKWQAAAEAAGGPGSRIVLSKPKAKQMIFDYLYDAFCPMTITQIYEGLQATIPSPVLKACLDDMSLDNDLESQFADSDDEGPAKKKKKASIKDLQNDTFQSSLSFKAGKTSKSTLYWVDYSKAKDGNGLGPEAKAKLFSDLSESEAEKEGLASSIQTMEAETKQLLSEPTNEEAIVSLEQQESLLADLMEKLDEARKLQVNESHKRDLKSRIEHLANVWRKRRRTCMDFLVSMEEWTDGSITAKKSLAGEGHIELESDELVAKGAVEYARNKAKSRLGGKKRAHAEISSTKIQPDEAFVALLMDKNGDLTRVFTTDDHK